MIRHVVLSGIKHIQIENWFDKIHQEIHWNHQKHLLAFITWKWRTFSNFISQVLDAKWVYYKQLVLTPLQRNKELHHSYVSHLSNDFKQHLIRVDPNSNINKSDGKISLCNQNSRHEFVTRETHWMRNRSSARLPQTKVTRKLSLTQFTHQKMFRMNQLTKSLEGIRWSFSNLQMNYNSFRWVWCRCWSGCARAGFLRTNGVNDETKFRTKLLFEICLTLNNFRMCLCVCNEADYE